jgi:hypothetical protein
MGISIARGVSAEIPRRVIGITIDGGTSAITTGDKGYIIVPYEGKIKSWNIQANTTGSAVIDVWKTSYPTIPSVSESITGSDKPTLSSAQLNRNLDITAWTDLTVKAEDIVGFNLDSVDGIITSLTLTLQVE